MREYIVEFGYTPSKVDGINEEIVRCINCVYRTNEPDPPECGPVTPKRWVDWCCFMHKELQDLHGFCKWGEYKEGGDD